MDILNFCALARHNPDNAEDHVAGLSFGRLNEMRRYLITENEPEALEIVEREIATIAAEDV